MHVKSHTYKPVEMCDDDRKSTTQYMYKHTCDTHFKSTTDNIYDFGRPYFLLLIFYPSTDIFTKNRFYPSK